VWFTDTLHLRSLSASHTEACEPSAPRKRTDFGSLLPCRVRPASQPGSPASSSSRPNVVAWGAPTVLLLLAWKSPSQV